MTFHMYFNISYSLECLLLVASRLTPSDIKSNKCNCQFLRRGWGRKTGGFINVVLKPNNKFLHILAQLWIKKGFIFPKKKAILNMFHWFIILGQFQNLYDFPSNTTHGQIEALYSFFPLASPPSSAFPDSMLEIHHRASWVLGKDSTSEPHSQPQALHCVEVHSCQGKNLSLCSNLL